MTESPNQLLEDRSVVSLELFFDLAFALGITQTVAMIVSGHDGQALPRRFHSKPHQLVRQATED